MPILQQSDFATGIYRLTQSTGTQGNVTAEINESINRIESIYLTKLLGIKLKSIFDSDYVDPIPEIWENLINGCIYESDRYGFTVEFKGFKEALKLFTYQDVIGKEINHSEAGLFTNNVSSGNKLNANQVRSRQIAAYNEAVVIYRNAFDFLEQNKDLLTEEWKYSPISFIQ